MITEINESYNEMPRSTLLKKSIYIYIDIYNVHKRPKKNTSSALLPHFYIVAENCVNKEIY